MTISRCRPFVMQAKDYYVIDGDTFGVMAPPAKTDDPVAKLVQRHRPLRPEAFRIRLRSVNAPEMPRKGSADDIFKDLDIDQHRHHPGMIAKRALQEVTRKRALLCVPTGKDRYRRLLCDVYASGEPGPRFEISEAFSIARHMHDRGLATTMDFAGGLPSRYPDMYEIETMSPWVEDDDNTLSP